MHQRKQIAVAVAMAISSMGAIAQTADTTTVQSVEVTGSRIKRAAAEGALPVTVVTRQQLDDSGAVTVAEFIRNTTFSSAGQFRPQSGSSAQSYAGANLRGLGSSRTLVLVDGRRVAKAPNVGDAADMNSIPMAAVERIEILTDGASAVYGSEAIGGVINIILRKDF
ncbi:MAG TPA: TonB-dependent receptor plug domain-containing protein, partial [Telluria sp.]|nr:TonB-dependent receptor plug domain-containing protein [Telluria sp.]